MKDLDKYVLIAMVYIFGWSLAFFIAWLVLGEEPSVLEGCILTPGVVELVCTAFIKSGKKHKEEAAGSEEVEQLPEEDEIQFCNVDGIMG